VIDHSEEYSFRKRTYEAYVSKRARPGTSYQESDYRRWAESAQTRFAGWFPKDHSLPILDLGCGHGNGLYLLERSGYANLTGVDLGSEQLTLAAKYAPAAVLVHDDVFHYLAGCSEQFALILCLNVIEHFDKNELLRFLDLLVNALKPGGRVIFETPNAESPWFGAVAFADLTHEWFFTPRGLSDLLGLVGLEGFEARSSEPEKRLGKTLIRHVTWLLFKWSLTAWNLAETGSTGSGIYTRVFAASAVKPGPS